MVPTLKSEGSSSKKSSSSFQRHHQHSKSYSQDSQNPSGSPSSKSYSSSRGTNGEKGSRGQHRRRRSSPTSKSALRETLSSFGDDVIKVKNYPRLYGYDNNGYFQPDFPFESSYNVGGSREVGEGMSSKEGGEASVPTSASVMEKGMVENELAAILSVHDPNFQTKQFERVHPSEVGVRSSKWQKLFQASASSSRFQKLKRISKRGGKDDEWPSHSSNNQTYFEQFYDSNGRIDISPPYWGVSRQTRDKISILGLSLILHELACFTSCILLGCTIFQGMEAISWVQQKPFTDNRIFFKWYSSFQTLLVVITSVGFLNRVDTTERRSLWLLPLFLIPVLCLSVSDYCNKAWELQRLECINYHNLDDLSKLKVHLSQDCSPILSALGYADSQGNSTGLAGINSGPGHLQNIALLSTTARTAMMTHPPSRKPVMELDTRGVAPLVMRIVSALSTLIISGYLFCCRKSYFLVDLFGPPEEVKGSMELFMLNSNEKMGGSKRYSGLGGAGDAPLKNRHDEEDGMEVIYQRGQRARDTLPF